VAVAFLIGIVLVALVAGTLVLTPPTRVGALSSLSRLSAAFLLIGLGVFVETRGLTLPALLLAGIGGYLLLRNRLNARGAASRASARGEAGQPASAQGQMTREEAYAVLGLARGAGEDDIRRAHHDLMQKIHPDHGGTSYLATKINVARDTLLAARKS